MKNFKHIKLFEQFRLNEQAIDFTNRNAKLIYSI